jgi:hypothetical protein
MPLSQTQQSALVDAMRRYDFPCVTYDFVNRREKTHDSMKGVEMEIRGQLLADRADGVRAGLANVLYWGYARIGYRDRRVKQFQEQVTDQQLVEARSLFRRLRGPGVCDIKRVGLPQFSGLSFVSKVRMFLDPCNYVVLDQKLVKLRDQTIRTIFCDVTFPRWATSIPINKPNEEVYERWCQLCRRIASEYLQMSGYRAVDVERGIFQMVAGNNALRAAEIVAAA